MTTIVNWIVFGDSLSEAGAGPFYQVCGISLDLLGNASEVVVPTTGGMVNRYCYTWRGYDPLLLMVNTAISGTALNHGGLGDASDVAPAIVDPLFPIAYNGIPKRIYILSGFYHNLSSNNAQQNCDLLVSYFNARRAVAAARGIELACMTMPYPSTNSPNESYDITPRHGINAIVTDPIWQSENNIYVPDVLNSVPQIYADGAYADTDYFIDGVHWTYDGASLVVPGIRSELNQIIADYQ